MELGYILAVLVDAARKMRTGDIKSLKLQAASTPRRGSPEFRLWYLAGEPEPTTPLLAGPPDAARGRKSASGPWSRELLKAYSIGDLLESALLLHDEAAELRARVRRLVATWSKNCNHTQQLRPRLEASRLGSVLGPRLNLPIVLSRSIGGKLIASRPSKASSP